MINDYRRLRTMPAAEAPIDAESLAEAPFDAKSWAEALPPWQFRQWPTPRYKLLEWWSLGNGLGSWDNEGRDPFGYFLVSHFSSSLLWISAWYKWCRRGFYHQLMEVEFPFVQDPAKGCHQAIPIGSRTYNSVWVGTRQKCTMLPSLSFPFLLYGFCSPEGLHLKRGIM